MKTIPWALAAVTALVASSASATPKGMNLQEAEWWAADTAAVNKKGEAVNQACGTKLKASYDEASYDGVKYDEARHAAACRAGLDALKTVCRTDLGKAAVLAKVKSASCRHSRSGTRVELKEGRVVFFLDPKNGSISGDRKGGYSWISAIKERL